ncbi:uncharacterized protein LOC143922273 [Arctopsyche grandis]|uniref:uncharacterized protein LOC143922273 n=1 Tax=Arctopsyche grandis TaxID=121162 RepID=UPI00406D87EE
MISRLFVNGNSATDLPTLTDGSLTAGVAVSSPSTPVQSNFVVSFERGSSFEHIMSSDYNNDSSSDIDMTSESGTTESEMPTEHEMSTDESLPECNTFKKGYIHTSLHGCIVCRRAVSKYIYILFDIIVQ